MSTQRVISEGKRVVSNDNRRRVMDSGADCIICCDDPQPPKHWYELIPCPGQDGARTDYIISQTIYDLVGPAAILRIGLYCYTIGGEVDPTGRTKAPGVFTGHATCEDCVDATYPCVPDNEESLTDEQIEATYPDIGAKFEGINICSCFRIRFPDGGIKLVDTGLGGHEYMMDGDPIDREDDGHCRAYNYGSINWPANAQVGDLQVSSQAHSESCDGPVAGNPSEDFFEVEISILLCCSEADGWTWDLDSPQGLSVFNFLCFTHSGGAGPAGTWNGAANPIASLDNERVSDVDCDENGIGTDSACGDGALKFYAHPPGF